MILLGKFAPDKIESYSNCDNEGYLLEVDVKYPEVLHDLHNGSSFLCAKR